MSDVLTDAEYRAIDCESFSSIKYILDSPLEYLRNKNTPFKGSSATRLGTAVHHYFQGNRHLVAVNPYKSISSPEYPKYEAEFMESAGEEGIIITKAQGEVVNAIMTNFNAVSFATELLTDVKLEEPFFFTYNDVKMKGKVDAHSTNRVIEIKTTGSCEDAWQFKQNAVISKHYDMQAYGYLTGLGYTEEQFKQGEVKHYFIVALTKPPYSVNVYRLSLESFISGGAKLNQASSAYKRFILDKQPYIPEPVLEEV